MPADVAGLGKAFCEMRLLSAFRSQPTDAWCAANIRPLPERIEPWTPAVARGAFLQRFNELTLV